MSVLLQGIVDNCDVSHQAGS